MRGLNSLLVIRIHTEKPQTFRNSFTQFCRLTCYRRIPLASRCSSLGLALPKGRISLRTPLAGYDRIKMRTAKSVKITLPDLEILVIEFAANWMQISRCYRDEAHIKI